jgi:hypothetical protein
VERMFRSVHHRVFQKSVLPLASKLATGTGGTREREKEQERRLTIIVVCVGGSCRAATSKPQDQSLQPHRVGTEENT